MLFCFCLSLTSNLAIAQSNNALPSGGYPHLTNLFKIETQHNPIRGIMPDSRQGLPFFCYIESLIEKQSKIAFRFRLGNLDYVNSLEYKK